MRKWIFVIVCITFCLFSCVDKKVNINNQNSDAEKNVSTDNQDSDSEMNVSIDNQDNDSEDEVVEYEISNSASASNLSLGGMVTSDLEWHYLSVHHIYSDGNSIRVSLEDDTKEILLEYPIREMSVNGDWLYYTIESVRGIDNGIYRVKKDGSQNECILKADVKRLKVYNERLYYRLKDDYSLYSISFSSDNNQKVLDGPIFNFQIVDETIYYYDGDVISRYDMKTEDSSVLGTFSPPFVVSGEYLYYWDKSPVDNDSKSINRVHVSADEEPEVIVEDAVENFFIDGNNIYFTKGALEEREIFICNLDGSDVQKLLVSNIDLTIGSLRSVMDGYIYFGRSYDGEEHDLMRLDQEGNIIEVKFNE